MAEKIAHLDCCPEPVLKTVRRLRRTANETESIRRCKSCGAHWYYHMRELASAADETDRPLWCARLNEEQASRAMELKKTDLSFLPNLPGYLRDGEGIRKLVREPQL